MTLHIAHLRMTDTLMHRFSRHALFMHGIALGVGPTGTWDPGESLGSGASPHFCVFSLVHEEGI